VETMAAELSHATRRSSGRVRALALTREIGCLGESCRASRVQTGAALPASWALWIYHLPRASAKNSAPLEVNELGIGRYLLRPL